MCDIYPDNSECPNWIRPNPRFTVSLGASLPSLPELQAKLVGLISAPARQIATIVAVPAKQIITVTKAYEGAKKVA